MISLAIVGGRDYTDYDTFEIIVDEYIKEMGIPLQIVSGGATGVDTMAELYAKKHNIPTLIFKADWKQHGKKAGILRNIDIIDAATHVLAVPTAKSIGTYDSINRAKKLNKVLKVVNV